MRFFADPATERQVRAYLTRFLPLALDRRNGARPGTSTTVHLSLRRPPALDGRRLPDAVRKVTAWASTDGGRTWHLLRVRHAGGAWTTAVRNPAHGLVSLRSRVFDTHGGNATTTVIRAYAVG